MTQKQTATREEAEAAEAVVAMNSGSGLLNNTEGFLGAQQNEPASASRITDEPPSGASRQSSSIANLLEASREIQIKQFQSSQTSEGQFNNFYVEQSLESSSSAQNDKQNEEHARDPNMYYGNASRQRQFQHHPLSAPMVDQKKPFVGYFNEQNEPVSVETAKNAIGLIHSSSAEPEPQENDESNITASEASFRSRKPDTNTLRPFPCVYKGCPWSFARQSDQRRHLRSHEKPTYFCPYWKSDPTCHRNGGSFNRQDVLKRHLKLVHFVQFKQSESGWCRACQKMFPNPKYFVAHCEKCAQEVRPAKWQVGSLGGTGSSKPSSQPLTSTTAGAANTSSSSLKAVIDPTFTQDVSAGANKSSPSSPPLPATATAENGLRTSILKFKPSADPKSSSASVEKPTVTRSRVRKQDASVAAREAEAAANAIASAGVKGSTSTLKAMTMEETMKSVALRTSTNMLLMSPLISGTSPSSTLLDSESAAVKSASSSRLVSKDEILDTTSEQDLLLAHMRQEQEMDDVNVVTSTTVLNSGPGPLTQPIYNAAGAKVRKIRPPGMIKKGERRGAGRQTLSGSIQAGHHMSK